MHVLQSSLYLCSVLPPLCTCVESLTASARSHTPLTLLYDGVSWTMQMKLQQQEAYPLVCKLLQAL